MNEDTKLVSLTQEVSQLKGQLKKSYLKQGLFKALAIEMESWIVPIKPLPRVIDRADDSKITEHAVLHLSDEHADQVVEAHRVGFMEDFNFNVALCRAEKLIDTVIDWTTNKLPMHTFPVLHIFLNGDHSSGEIHGATSHSHHKNMFRNALSIAQMHSLMFRDLAPYFPKIKIYCTSGNHGRRSTKKNYYGPWDNWDYLVHETAKQLCADIPNIEFLIPESFSMNVIINGFGFHVCHGDDVRGWMGLPWYGLERKTRRLVSLHQSQGQKVDYFVFGHFHACSTTADLTGEMIVNGAFPATDPYSYDSFSGYRTPMQMFHGVHQKHGISWRLPVKIKDTKAEAKGPRRYKITLATPEG